jgi:outer membrane protein assembly factor BamB
LLNTGKQKIAFAAEPFVGRGVQSENAFPMGDFAMWRCITLLTVCGIIPALPARADDWSQFRGDTGTAVGGDAKLPGKWDLQTNLMWQIKLPGPGASSPIIRGDRVYLTYYSGYGVEARNPGERKQLVRHLVSLNRQNGQIVWTADMQTESPEANYGGMMTQHGYASHTPATDGTRIYVFLGTGGVHAFDMEGKPQWNRPVGQKTDQWGSASSLRLDGNVVIVNAAIECGHVLGLNKESGEELWRFPVSGRSWSTPAIVDVEDGRHELIVSATGKISGLDPATGKELWHCAGLDDYTCPSVVPGKGIAYVAGARQSSIIAVRCGNSPEAVKNRVLWKAPQVGANVPSPVLYQGHLFGVGDRGGIAYCVNAETGKVEYKQRLSIDEAPVRPVVFQPAEEERGGRRGRGGRGPGGGRGGFGPGGGGGVQVYASAVAADGKIFVPSRNSGVFVLAAKPEFEVLARNQFAEDSTTFDATPAIGDGQILFRSNSHLYCVGLKK